MNVSPEFSLQFLEGYRSGLAQAVAESAAHANAVTPWYKAILAHPFLASALVYFQPPEKAFELFLQEQTLALLNQVLNPSH